MVETDLALIRLMAGTRLLERPSFAGGGELALADCRAHERKFLLESHLALKRAGADIQITYAARELAQR